MTTSSFRFPIIVLAALLAGTASGAATAATVSGPHANEEFCKTAISQFGHLMKPDPRSPDTAKRAKFFADWKALNAAMAKTAPASLASDVALTMKNSNAMIDAQLAGDPARIKAATELLSSPEDLAAGERMNGYCGFKP